MRGFAWDNELVDGKPNNACGPPIGRWLRAMHGTRQVICYFDFILGGSGMYSVLRRGIVGKSLWKISDESGW